MHTIHIPSVMNAGREYDIFIDSPPVDQELLHLGIFPPLPVRNGTLVWGFRQVETALETGFTELPAIEVTGDEISLLSTALRLENRKDAFSLREKAKIFEFLEKRGLDHRSEELSSYIQTEGSFAKQAEKYRGFSDAQRNMVDSGLVDLKTAGVLSSFTQETISLMEEVFSSFSFSKRRTALLRIYEISIRDSLSPEEVHALVVRLSREENPFSLLETLRYPTLTAMKKRFEDTSSPVLKGSGITLSEPEGFEGSGFSVSFTFTSRKQLTRIIKTLENLEEVGDELFSLLR